MMIQPQIKPAQGSGCLKMDNIQLSLAQ